LKETDLGSGIRFIGAPVHLNDVGHKEGLPDIQYVERTSGLPGQNARHAAMAGARTTQSADRHWVTSQ
jgi:hypothetical protein